MATADEVLAAATPHEGHVAVCLRGDLLARLDELAERYAAALDADRMSNQPDTAPLVLDEIRALRAEIDAAEVDFRFRAIPSTDWAALMAKHPDPEQLRAFGPSFPAAAIAASLVEPTGFDEAKVLDLERAVNDGAWSKLWGCCLEVNRGDGDLPKFVQLFALIDASASKPTTPAPTASPTPSSPAA